MAATDENAPAPQIPSHAGLAEPEPAAAVLTTESATAAAMQCATDMLPAFERKLSFLETGGGSASVENDEDAEKSSRNSAAGYRLVSMQSLEVLLCPMWRACYLELQESGVDAHPTFSVVCQGGTEF